MSSEIARQYKQDRQAFNEICIQHVRKHAM
jgi:hypothetical protein